MWEMALSIKLFFVHVAAPDTVIKTVVVNTQERMCVRKVLSKDLKSWSTAIPTVASSVVAYRPGMANVRTVYHDALPFAAYMTYEVR